ncbi:hypothetical protein [Candidatus Fokinia crypta]|nr:hypothetical protein [Candidatus Fokinia cryptica]
MAFIIMLVLLPDLACYASSKKEENRCSRFNAIYQGNCNGKILALHIRRLTGGTIEVTSPNPFNASYKVSIYECMSHRDPLNRHTGCAYNYLKQKEVFTFNPSQVNDIRSYSEGSLCKSGVFYKKSGKIVTCLYSYPTGDIDTSTLSEVQSNVLNELYSFQKTCNKDNAYVCVCGIVEEHYLEFHNDFQSRNVIGCVPMITLPPPPTFNQIVTPVVVVSIQSPSGDLQKWFEGIGSTFDAPTVQVQSSSISMYESPPTITLQYSFDKPENLQNCQKLPNVPGTFCPSISIDGSSICVTQNFTDGSSSSSLGCVPRPSIGERSNIVIMPYYNYGNTSTQSVVVGVLQSMNDTITPIPATGTLIGTDSNGAPLYLDQNYNLVTLSSSNQFQSAECSLAKNLGSNIGDPSAHACKLSSGYTIKIATLMSSDGTTPLTSIGEYYMLSREYVPLKTTSVYSKKKKSPEEIKYYSYAQSIVGLQSYSNNIEGTYNLSIKALILGNSAQQKYMYLTSSGGECGKNCEIFDESEEDAEYPGISTLKSNVKMKLSEIKAKVEYYAKEIIPDAQSIISDNPQITENAKVKNFINNPKITNYKKAKNDLKREKEKLEDDVCPPKHCWNCSSWKIGAASANAIALYVPGGWRTRKAKYCYCGDDDGLCHAVDNQDLLSLAQSNQSGIEYLSDKYNDDSDKGQKKMKSNIESQADSILSKYNYCSCALCTRSTTQEKENIKNTYRTYRKQLPSIGTIRSYFNKRQEEPVVTEQIFMDRAVCPGIYDGPDNIYTHIPDKICIMSANTGWDFISGNNRPDNTNVTSILLPPQPVCTNLPSTCNISSGAVPNATIDSIISSPVEIDTASGKPVSIRQLRQKLKSPPSSGNSTSTSSTTTSLPSSVSVNTMASVQCNKGYTPAPGFSTYSFTLPPLPCHKKASEESCPASQGSTATNTSSTSSTTTSTSSSCQGSTTATASTTTSTTANTATATATSTSSTPPLLMEYNGYDMVTYGMSSCVMVEQKVPPYIYFYYYNNINSTPTIDISDVYGTFTDCRGNVFGVGSCGILSDSFCFGGICGYSIIMSYNTPIVQKSISSDSVIFSGKVSIGTMLGDPYAGDGFVAINTNQFSDCYYAREACAAFTPCHNGPYWELSSDAYIEIELPLSFKNCIDGSFISSVSCLGSATFRLYGTVKDTNITNLESILLGTINTTAVSPTATSITTSPTTASPPLLMESTCNGMKGSGAFSYQYEELFYSNVFGDCEGFFSMGIYKGVREKFGFEYYTSDSICGGPSIYFCDVYNTKVEVTDCAGNNIGNRNAAFLSNSFCFGGTCGYYIMMHPNTRVLLTNISANSAIFSGRVSIVIGLSKDNYWVSSVDGGYCNSNNSFCGTCPYTVQCRDGGPYLELSYDAYFEVELPLSFQNALEACNEISSDNTCASGSATFRLYGTVEDTNIPNLQSIFYGPVINPSALIPKSNSSTAPSAPTPQSDSSTTPTPSAESNKCDSSTIEENKNRDNARKEFQELMSKVKSEERNITMSDIENTQYLKNFKEHIKCTGTEAKCIGGVFSQNVCIPSDDPRVSGVNQDFCMTHMPSSSSTSSTK